MSPIKPLKMDAFIEFQNYDEDVVLTLVIDILIEQELADNLAEKTLSRCRNLLNKIFLSESATDSGKRMALETIDWVLNIIKPHTLIGEKDTDRTTLLNVIDYMISIIETHGPPQLDDMNIIEDIISLRPTEIFLKVSCRNVILCLEEFKELLKRADGNQTTDHQLDDRSPFLGTEYFSFLPGEQTTRVERYFYPFEPVDLLSANSVIELTKIIDEETNRAIPNSLLLEKYIKKANVCLESHKNELSCENNPLKMSLDEKFMTMIMYLMRFTELIDVGNFDENQELNKKVLNNLRDFYYILTTLPLTQVLKPIGAQKMISYFKDVIFASTIALTPPDSSYESSLVQILMKLKTAAYQLWHMCLKQLAPLNKAAACVIYLEYQAQMDIQADVITENSLSDWKVKFGRLANKEEVLSGCNLDSCCICFQPFVDEDTNSTPRDLAVLPKCIHLFCVECLEQSIAKSEVK